MIYVIIRGIKKIVRFTVDFVKIDVRYIEVLLAGYIVISGKEGAVQIINYRMMFSGNVFDTLVQFSPNNRNSISK